MTAQPTIWSQVSQDLFQHRYLTDGETIEQCLQRISLGNPEYLGILERQEFLPNTPTIINLGKNSGTLSACFKFDVPDSMEGIFEVAKKAAMVLKYGGGVGYTLSELRAKGSPVRTTHKISSGPVGFMPVYQATAMSITQGGVRQGAQMAILSCDHPDLWEFINAKDSQEKADALSTFNISVAASDAWMGKWSQEARDELNPLWQMALNAWKTGDPGCYFIDTAERGNPTPWLGRLTGTNPCGEVPLLDNEPCNLGSINLLQVVDQVGVNWERLEEVTRIAIRYLDDILDHNEFPDPAITEIAYKTRKLGLGVMGWADMLAVLGIDYDSDDAVDLGRDLMARINVWAKEESTELGKEKGIAPAYVGTSGAFNGYRNATRTCIAPTGSISILCDVSSGIEPHFALEWNHRMYDGTILPRRAKSLDIRPDFTPRTAGEIDPIWHIKHQAAFQENTDLAVSKTINLPNSATPEEIFEAYVYAWKVGCKGVTVFRDGSRSEQVLTSPSVPGNETTERTFSSHEVNDQFPPVRAKLERTRRAINHKFDVADLEGYINVGLYEDGHPGELFITASKEGSTVSGLLQTIGIQFSLLLQHGVPLETICDKLINMRFEPAGITGNTDIPQAWSISDYIGRWIKLTFLGGEDEIPVAPVERKTETTGLECPDCKSTQTYAAEGCITCSNCGWTKCG